MIGKLLLDTTAVVDLFAGNAAVQPVLPPPQVLLVTLATSNTRMREVLRRTLAPAVTLLEGGEQLVEIGEV